MLIHELSLKGLLSFGPDSRSIALRPLNVIIGPNGSGKSNLIEAIGLFRAAPRDLSAPVKEVGGVRDWLFKGNEITTASIEAVISNPENSSMPLRHQVVFGEHGNRFEVISEKIENKEPHKGYNEPFYFYRMDNGYPRLKELGLTDTNDNSSDRDLRRESINPEMSILSQVKDPERYPALTYLSEVYEKIRVYREWSFGRYTPPRQPQKADLPSVYLMETCENLALVLNSLRPRVKHSIIDALNSLYPGIDDFNVQIDGGWVQLYLEEGRFSIPATRLSDGTLRYLSLLAVLLNPDPPPLICIEEPELGLHPDVLPKIADLLKDASERSQLVVTTHSEILIDALTDSVESVLVCEKHEGQTQLARLSPDDLSEWLDRYRLGELWIKGEIGGTRW